MAVSADSTKVLVDFAARALPRFETTTVTPICPPPTTCVVEGAKAPMTKFGRFAAAPADGTHSVVTRTREINPVKMPRKAVGNRTC